MIRRAFALVIAAAGAPGIGSGQGICPRAGLPAYAHNDYGNAHPLTDALALGYRGVEADVFLVDGVLRLGHDRRRSRTGGSLEASYLAPLQALAARCGSLTTEGTPFLLAVELKEASRASFDSLVSLLMRYPSVTSSVEVVLVGWRPEPAVLNAAPIPFGWQHRLRRPEQASGAAFDRGVRLLSLDYGKTLGRWWVREAGRRRWLAALRSVKAAHPTLQLRVHNVPVDRDVYRTLLAAGVDLIGTKDLPGTARLLQSPPDE